jgi:membrane fusion protein (multidrug efflux system)
MARTITLFAGTAVFALAAVSYVYLNRAESDAPRQSTNDAYTQADFTNVASRLSGVVEQVLVEDNQKVERGDLLAVLDDRDFRIASRNAAAAIAVGKANVEGIRAQIARQGSVIEEARSTVSADDAILVLARSNHLRAVQLSTKGSVTIQALEEAQSALATATASRASHAAALDAAIRQVDILDSQLEAARGSLIQAEASLEEAELKLSYARITAPISGTVGQRSVRTGAYISAGTPLLSLVPLDRLYVRANFRETQLAAVRPGQPVSLQVDALPGITFKGAVESLGPASGASFSPIAPQNATGNFTKIVQRLPVRISLEPGQPGLDLLRVGMSVVPEIRVERPVKGSAESGRQP